MSIYNFQKFCRLDQLETEIKNSSIVTALDYITGTDTETTVVFKATLSTGDETTLNTIVTNHTPIAVVETAQAVRLKGNSDGTYIGNEEDRVKAVVKFDKNSNTTDSNGLLRVTGTKQIFGYYFNQTLHPRAIRNKVDNGATFTLDTSVSSAVLTATTATDSRAQMESKFITRYTVGRSHYITMSVTFGAGQVGYGKRAGYYSDTNGYFFEHLDGESEIRIGLRSNASGVSGFSLPQSQWNLDKLDGTGPSGMVLDKTKSAVFIIEYTWHGNGTIRWGVQYKKDIVFVHEHLADNQNTHTLTRNPSQPVKFECFRTGNGSPSTSEPFYIHALSANVLYLGPIEPTYSFSASRGITSITVPSNSFVPVLSIRPSLLFNGRINRSLIVPKIFRLLSTSSPLHIQVIADATLTGASWTALSNGSSVEKDQSATAVSGGTIIYEDYISAGTVDDFDLTKLGSPELESFILGLSIDGTVADTLTIVARSLTNNSTTYASVFWGEYQ